MTYRLDITVDSNNAVETIQILNNIIYFLDDIIYDFSSEGVIDNVDVPIIVDFQNEGIKDPITNKPIVSHLYLSNKRYSSTITDIDLPPKWFKLGDFVRHVSTGLSYRITASAYYHLQRSWFHLCHDENLNYKIYAASRLMTESLFEQLPTMLFNVTGKSWTWNFDQAIFVCDSSPSRKMRPIDALNTWRMDFKGQEVPF